MMFNALGRRSTVARRSTDFLNDALLIPPGSSKLQSNESAARVPLPRRAKAAFISMAPMLRCRRLPLPGNAEGKGTCTKEFLREPDPSARKLPLLDALLLPTL